LEFFQKNFKKSILDLKSAPDDPSLLAIDPELFFMAKMASNLSGTNWSIPKVFVANISPFSLSYVVTEYVSGEKPTQTSEATNRLAAIAGQINSHPVNLDQRAFLPSRHAPSNKYMLSDSLSGPVLDKINEQVGEELELNPAVMSSTIAMLEEGYQASRKAFSHGDLHLHNVIERKGIYYILDWGAVGCFPVGFDLGEIVAHEFNGKDVEEVVLGDIIDIYCNNFHGAKIAREEVFYGLLYCYVTWLLPNHMNRAAYYYAKNWEGRAKSRTEIAVTIVKLIKILLS
jgi:Phosphotransferase enzyme family